MKINIIKIPKQLLKILAGIIVFLLVIFILVKFIILIPAVQNTLKNKIASTLQEQLNSAVTIEKIDIRFPKKISVDKLLITGEKKDTLVNLGNLSVSVRILPLIKHRIVVNEISLTNSKGDFGKLLGQIPEEPTENATETNEESNSWGFEVQNIKFENCYFKYRDNSEKGFELILDFGKVDARVGTVNLDTLIKFSYLETKNSYVSYQNLSVIESEEDSLFSFADIRVDRIDLQHSGFSYIDSLGAVIVNIKTDEIKVNDLLVDITTDAVTLDKGNADNLFVEILLLPETDTLPETNDYLNWGQSLTDWNFEGNELKVKDTRVKIENVDMPNTPGHFNGDHLDLNYLTGTLSDFTVADNIIDLEFKNLSGKEMNGLDVIQLDAEIHTTPSEFRIDEFKLKTSSGDYDIQLQTTMSPTNYMDINGKSLDLKIDVNGNSWHDMDYFSSFLQNNSILAKNFINNPFRFQARISGKTEDLYIEQFDFSYLNSTQISAKGNIKNANISDAMAYQLELGNLFVSKTDFNKTLNPFLPDSVFTFPQFIRLNGKFNGNNESMNFNGKITTNNGTINIQNLIAGFADKKHYEASISVDLNNFNEVIHYDLTRVKLDLTGSFSGNDLYSGLAMLQLNVDTVTYLNHPYNNISIKGESDSGMFDIHYSSLDSSLLLAGNLSGGFYEHEKNGRLTLDVKNIDLKKLNMVTDDFRLEGNTGLNFTFDSITDFKANLNLDHLNFYFSDTIYRMHPIEFVCASNNENTTLNLKSFYYNLDFRSKGNWQKMADGIAHLPHHYFEEDKNDSLEYILPEFDLSGQLEFPEAFARLFFPDLPAFRSLDIKGNYTKSTDELYFGFKLPGLQNDALSSDSILFSMQGNSDELNFSGLAFLNVNDVLKGNLDISGRFDEGKLNSVVQYFDSYSQKYLGINTLFRADSNQYYMHIVPDSLTFSYDSWQINPENRVTIGAKKISFSNFEVISNEQKIFINSGEKNNKDWLQLQLVNFGMGSIENLLSLDTLVYGTANADFLFTDIFTSPVIDGSLSIENMNMYDFDFGKLDISEFHFEKNELDYTLSLIGPKEHVESTGKWNFDAETENLDATLEIKKLELAELEYLLADVISNPKGNITASLKLTGNTENPVINGVLNFKDVGLGIDELNEYFTIGNEPIAFENNSVLFNHLQLTNRNGRSARLNGTVSLDPKSMGEQDLVITTDNMELLNTSENDNNLYYGFLKAQTNIQLSGKRNSLKVDAKTKIDKNTSMTYIFPDVLTLNDNKGIVSFGEYSPDSTEISAYQEEQEALKSLAIENIKANIEVESGTRFKIYFDETKSDYLDAVLNGNINYNLNGDNSEISGTMSLTEGKLRYSLPMVSVKDYTIEPGSSITVSNDVYNPFLNIVASTSIRASTEKLIENYVKVMSFTVLLKMSGELNNMKLEFDISPETDDVLVSSKLSSLSPVERNINALNLLVRGSFTITLKGDEVGSASMYESGLDKFYSAQLNHLISENIHFVDVNFDVQSFADYGKYGESVIRRNYYYNVGKSLFNNRARINYKGSFDFSNSHDKQTLNSQFLQNELNLEINLTDDGTWKALFYNRNKYEGILEGKIMETGGGIKLHKEFYSIGDFLNGNEERKEKRRLKKQEAVISNNKNTEEQE